MEATRSDGVVRAGPAAREQFYDARGYGRPSDGEVLLAPVEAAHLLFRGDLEAVDGLGFVDFLASSSVSGVAFQVYMDLRDRGFYLSPVDAGPAGVSPDAVPGPADTDDDFVVYPRGKGPWDDAVAYRVRAVSERSDVPASALLALAGVAPDDGPAGDRAPDGGGAGARAPDEEHAGDSPADDGAAGDRSPDDEGVPGVLAVVDEESELTYLGVAAERPTGTTDHDLPGGVPATVLADRVLVPDPPGALYDRAFYGQRLDREGAAVQLSLVEAAALAMDGVLAVPDGAAGLLERGRAVEGDRFDRRLRVYRDLRAAGVVPKTGFKFGADFRTYSDVDAVADLGHSELLVRVLPGDHVFDPRDVALDVRLAHGVRKRMVFALVEEGDDEGAAEAGSGRDAADAAWGVRWLGVERLTP